MQPTEYIALDVGAVRTGMARASSVARLAEPLKTIPTGEVQAAISKIIASEEVAAIIVGLPRNLKGEDTEQTHWVRRWTDQLKKTVSVPVYFQDEALTSRLAESRGADKSNVDAEAASLILQDYIDQNLMGEANA